MMGDLRYAKTELGSDWLWGPHTGGWMLIMRRQGGSDLLGRMNAIEARAFARAVLAADETPCPEADVMEAG